MDDASHSTESVPMHPLPPSVSPLTIENVLWANTVLAAGSAVGFVIYTGPETRARMNTSHPGTKIGLLDLEINNLAKVKPFACEVFVRRSTLMFTDPLRCDFCSLHCARCVEWFQRALVHLCLSLLDLVFVDHSYKVRAFTFLSRKICVWTWS